MGKTTLATNLVEAAALGELVLPVAWISLQESADLATERLLASRAGYSRHAIRSGLSSADFGKLMSVASEVADAPIIIEDQETSIMGLRHKLCRYRQEKDIHVIVVDSLQMLRSDSLRARHCFERELAESAQLSGDSTRVTFAGDCLRFAFEFTGWAGS